MDNFLAVFKNRLGQKNIKIAVVGLGYVGLPLAIEFAKKGFYVLGLEIDRERLERIRNKESYITDISSRELKKVILAKKFEVTNDFKRMKEIDVILICVPTPLKHKYHPNISYIKQAVKGMVKNM